MNYRYERRYVGPIQACIFDWAGTIVDFGSIAPARAFVETFRRHGVELTLAEARGPMGTAKRDHIAALLAMEAVAARWRDAHGAAAGEAEIDRLYADFIDIQLEVLAEHAALVPGTRETVEALRARGIRLGSTSGYATEMMAVNTAAAKRQGVELDSVVCASDVGAGRPGPAMALVSAAELGIGCVQACVKIDDTLAGIEEGLNAGMWSVGVVATGNELGLCESDWASLSADARERRLAPGRRRMAAAGAHLVIDGVADLLPALDEIEVRLARGERP